MRLTPVALALLFTTTAHAENRGVQPGEGFTFALSMGPIVGARARMVVGAPFEKNGRSLVYVQGEAETLSIVKLVAPMTAAYVLTLDVATLAPREIVSDEKGLHESSFHSLLDGKKLDLDLASPKGKRHQSRVMSREPRDPIAAYFALRASALSNGAAYDLDVLDGGALWRAHLVVRGREPLVLGDDPEHPKAPVAAIHIDGTLDRIDDAGNKIGRPQRSIALWVTDDASHVLLRTTFDSDLGRAKLDLTSYIPPARKTKLRQAEAALPGIQLSTATSTAPVTASAPGGVGTRR
ncbi:MAG: DUF3108 domain-containing protein [Polyangia bacterium]